MINFISGLLSFVIYLAIWTVVGHGIWILASRLLSGASRRNCPSCKKEISTEDRACRHCGWTSVPVDAKQGLTVCRQAMQGALQRKIIDEETLLRGEAILAELDAAINRETSPIPRPPVRRPSEHVATPLPVRTVDTKEIVQPLIVASVVTKEVQSVVPPVASAHPLDREYPQPSRSSASLHPPSRTWSQWLSAFMEESNIRWGELVGGLLIVCCSAALVISFWEHIAQRPWLKFSIFTGINVATFGLGLYAWYRWKLPTTSKGILVIGMMLLPLNFLAFALFTLGMPPDWLTIGGEMASLAILGCMAWQAAKVLTPSVIAITTLTPIAFALANLLIRRTVHEDAGTLLLYGWGVVLVGMAAAALAMVWRPLVVRSEGRFVPALEFLAITAFGLVLSGGLLYVCSGDTLATARTTSPLLALVALPLLFYAIGINDRIEKRSSLALPMILLGAAAVSIGGIAMILAWPTPRWMIGCALGWLGLIAVAAYRYRFAEFGFAVYLLLSAVFCLVWYIATQALPLDNASSAVMLQSMGTATTGFLLVAWSLVCASCSIVLAKLQHPRSSVVAMRSAAILAVVGTLLLTALGFGRVEYANSVGAVYAVYAACAFAVGRVRKRPWVEVIGAFFLAAAAVQTIAIGWVDQHVWIRIFACLMAVSMGLLVMLMIKKAHGQAIEKQDGVLSMSIVTIGLTTMMALLWIVLNESSQMAAAIPMAEAIPLHTSHFVMVTVLWALLAWVCADRGFWVVAQVMTLATVMLAALFASKPSPWFMDAPTGYIHPLMLQIWALCLVGTGAAFMAFGWLVQGLGRSRSEALLGPLAAIHDASVARFSVATGSLLVVGLLVYGAFPGVAQELIPRDALTSTERVEYQLKGETQSRDVPKLSALEWDRLPHSAASWGLGSDRFTLLGLGPCLAGWIASLLAIAMVFFDTRFSRRMRARQLQAKIWAALFLTVLLSLWFAIATRFEPDVAVASALRWLTASVYLLGCAALCFRIARTNRSAEPSATREFAWIDHVFNTLSLNALAPWLLMGSMVVASVLLQSQIMPWTWWAWAITGMMAIFAGFLILIQYNSGNASSQRAGRSVAFITASTLLVAPLITWVILQVAVTVLAHPLTGPNPDSVFARIGLAASYAIPILMVSVALVLVSAARPSPHLAFVSGQLLLVTVLVAYMLVLKSDGLRIVAWVGLAAALSATASLFSIVWRAYTARDHRSDAVLHWSGRPAPVVREEWQRSLRYISAGFAIVGLALIVLVVLINGRTIGDLHWASLGLAAALAILLSYFTASREPVDPSPWLVAGGVTCAGLIAPQWTSAVPSLCAAAVVSGIAGAILIALSSRGLEKRNARPYLNLILAFLMVIAFRLVATHLGWVGPATRSSREVVWILVGATALAIANAWVHRDRNSMVWALVIAQGAGFVYTTLYRPGPTGDSVVWNTLFVHWAILALMSSLGTLFGFGRRSRIPLIVAAIAMSLVCGGWMVVALQSPASALPFAFPQSSFLLAIAMCGLGGLTGYWNAHSRDENGIVYLSGLCGVVWFLNALQPTSDVMLWVVTMVLGAYCLATSFMWRAGDRIREEVAKLVWLPKPFEKPCSNAIVVMNIALAVSVAWLGLVAQFQNPNIAIRFSCAQAIMGVSLAVGFLARYASRSETMDPKLAIDAARHSGSTSIRVLALILGVLYAIALGWHVQTPSQTGVLDRLGVALFPLMLMGEVYGFGLIKWMGLKEEWQRAALKLMPSIVGVAITIGIACLLLELQVVQADPSAEFRVYTTICIALAISLTLVWCMAAALLPGRDPLGFSDRGRESYVYIAQGLLVMFVVHLRLTNAWLFQGLFQQVWPLFALVLGFGGLAVAEWARARGLRVLVNPLKNSGMLLPLLPILAPWIADSGINYGATLILASIGYGMFAYLQRSPVYGAASALAANGAIWYLLHRADFALNKHPQLWVIPPAMCVFLAAQWFRKHLAPQQLALARYVSVGSIYIASTSEIFLQGISKAPWLPIVLAFLSVLGIFYGIAARIRSMLWLGSMFLCVALFSILWYAAVDLEQTWIWYASGIALGFVILVIFALFEKRREDLKRIMNNVQQWEE